MLEIKNLLFQPLTLHLADSTKSIHLGSRDKATIKDKDLSQEIKKAQARGWISIREVAALTGKATKSTTAEMTSLFATGYGIYKTTYSKMSDVAFGKMFSGGMAAAVQAFKTTGSGMAEAISRLGAIATTAKIPLEEQIALLGGGLLVVGGMLLMSLGAIGMAIPAANTALASMGITATITGASIKAALLSAFWPVTVGIAVIYALKKAWDSNLGGIQDKVAAFWHTVSTVWNGVSALFSSGKVSEALHDELQKMALWKFVKNIYMVYYRLSEFFGGVYQQIKSAFVSLGEAFYPVFSALYGIIAPVGKAL